MVIVHPIGEEYLQAILPSAIDHDFQVVHAVVGDQGLAISDGDLASFGFPIGEFVNPLKGASFIHQLHAIDRGVEDGVDLRVEQRRGPQF